MNNTITFKYNGKIWNPKNPEKKLKQLGITWDDVEVIETSTKQKEVIEDNSTDNPNLYKFRNIKDNSTILSIYPDLEHLRNIINIDDYEEQHN